MKIDLTLYRSDAWRVLPIAAGSVPASIVYENDLVPIAIRKDCILIAVARLPEQGGGYNLRAALKEISIVCNQPCELIVVSSEALQYARARYLYGFSGGSDGI